MLPLGPFLESLRGLAWPSRRRAPGALPGSHPSRLRGSSPELSEYRLYRQGDDPRQLDWKLLARSDRAYLRLTEDRSILPTWLAIDASASMAWPPDSLGKWQTALTFAIGLASVAIAAGDPVGLVVAHPDRPVRLPPRSRRGTIREITATLTTLTPAGRPALAPALAALKPGVRLVVISDFLGDERDVLLRVRGLAVAGSDVHGIHIIAREELDLPRRVARAIDPEDASLVRPMHDQARAAYRGRFAAWRDDLARAWRQAGATWTPVSTADDPLRAMRRIVHGTDAAHGAGLTPAADTA